MQLLNSAHTNRILMLLLLFSVPLTLSACDDDDSDGGSDTSSGDMAADESSDEGLPDAEGDTPLPDVEDDMVADVPEDDVPVEDMVEDMPVPVCGDGVLVLGAEECDDGNDVDGDGCDSLCIDEFEYAVLIRGELASTFADIDEAQAYHDGLAAGGEEPARALGDYGHDAMLGTGLLGSTTGNDFLGIDRWTNAAGLAAFYSDPMFAEAFGLLFEDPMGPSVEIFVHQPGWHGWGDPTSGDAADPHFFVIVRGRLAEADPVAAQAAHDPVAAGGEAMVMAAGDVAHVVFTGLEDPQELFIIDIWNDDTNIEAVYSDPDFQAAFATIFDADGATLQIYTSEDGWYEW